VRAGDASGTLIEVRVVPSSGLTGRLGLSLLAGAAAYGCGGPAFESLRGGAEAGTPDAPAAEASTADGASSGDAGALDSGTGDAADAGGADAPGVCAPLAAGATDVYVDQRFAGTPRTGAAACPLSTILQGVAAASRLGGAVTIHVAGATPAIVYAETGPVTVGPGMFLRGAGPSRTTISASGTCGAGTCAAIVNGGGVIDGFTVVSPTGDGIVTGAGSPAPVVKNLSASGSRGNGIVALGAIELGPSAAVNGNGATGLQSPQGASGRLHVVGTSNSFDDNTGNGINVDGNAVLLFEGGTANRNFQGLRLAGVPPGGGGPHTITSLTATGNKGPGGVVAYNGQTIKMRSSSLLGNAAVGLLYSYVSGSTLDLGGGASDPGGNTFGGVTAASRNGTAGVRLCNVTGAGSLPAYGDLWSSCPPTQTFVACDTAIASYTDVAYAPAVTPTGPAVTTACATGP
jgi:hypothetical protein